MRVSELRELLSDADINGDMLVGAEDADGETVEIQFAGVVSHHETGDQYFFIRGNGGYPLLDCLNSLHSER